MESLVKVTVGELFLNPVQRYAPPPNDIIWENLSDKRQWVNLKKLVANLFIFIVAFFLTTPQLIVHQLDPILNALKNITGEMNRNEVNKG